MRCLKKTYNLALWLFVGMFIGIVIETAVTELYRLLGEFMPRLFPSYDIASGDKFFDSLYTSLWFISLMLTLLLSVYLSLRYNNDRFEHVIKKTEGTYEISDVLPTYVSIFAKSDIISSVICGIIYTVPMIFIPTQFINKGSFIAKLAEPYKMMSEALGFVFGPLCIILLLVLCHAVSVPLALKYYRAKWLTGFSEGEI